MTVKIDIISKATNELKTVDRQIIQLPEIIAEVQLNLDDLIVPAANFDRRVCELTIDVNKKIKELEVLNGLITGDCIYTEPDDDGNEVEQGKYVQFDVVQGGRNDSEDTNYVGNNPFSTTVFGATTNMMGGGDFENIITGNLGVGVTTLIGMGRSFFAQESKSTDDDGDDCSNDSGAYSTQRSALLTEIGELRAIRDNYMNETVNEVKKEIKFKYTQRHSYYFGLHRVKIRKTELETIINMANDPANETFYTQ